MLDRLLNEIIQFMLVAQSTEKVLNADVNISFEEYSLSPR
jgi:hypothetical protein